MVYFVLLVQQSFLLSTPAVLLVNNKLSPSKIDFIYNLIVSTE